jgi:hypothetical protein
MSALFRPSRDAIERALSVEPASFAIILGSGRYDVPRFQAACVSPHIHRALAADATTAEFRARAGVPDASAAAFFRFAGGCDGALAPGLAADFREIALCLGNAALAERLAALEPAEPCVARAAARLLARHEAELGLEPELGAVAARFADAPLAALAALPPDLLGAVLAHPALALASEDALVALLGDLGEPYLGLLEHVRCALLGPAALDAYLELLERAGQFACVNRAVLAHLVDRLRLAPAAEAQAQAAEAPAHACAEVPFDPGDPLGGVFKRMRERGAHVDVSSSGDCSGYCSSVTEVFPPGDWQSRCAPGAWVCFDFRGAALAPSHYTIMSDYTDNNHLLSWALEGSADGAEWACIDARSTDALNGNGRVATFAVARPPGAGFHRYVRLRQTGRNSSNNDHLLLNRVDFFGRQLLP